MTNLYLMLNAPLRIPTVDDPATVRTRSSRAMAELFFPPEQLLRTGGDLRLHLDPATGANSYGCAPFPTPESLSFASSTATSISERAYRHVHESRDRLMRSALALGMEAAFDARIEAMRRELKNHLALPADEVDVVFSPSGTDAQLKALFAATALQGPDLTTIVVAADQTGSGTEYTARGRHFSAVTAYGDRVSKGAAIGGFVDSIRSVGIALVNASGSFRAIRELEAEIIGAVENAMRGSGHVLLQVMDSSKLGLRAPSDRCVEEILSRWPGRVQILVDACQMRLGRKRLRNYLDRGHMVIVTGSKFFTGPAFSGALLVPSALATKIDAAGTIAPGLLDYSARSDWPVRLASLRKQFPVRINLGQWLRWEAALEEMRAYYAVPPGFRLAALMSFGAGLERIVKASTSLELLSLPEPVDRDEDGELAQQTIFPVLVRHGDRMLRFEECRALYRALASAADRPDVAAERPPSTAGICLVGQPVALGSATKSPAVLRICADARLVTEAWACGDHGAAESLKRNLDDVGTIVSKLEWLLAGHSSL